jgi:hypothetical protein
VTFGPFIVFRGRETAFEMPFVHGNGVFRPFPAKKRPFLAIPSQGNVFPNAYWDIISLYLPILKAPISYYSLLVLLLQRLGSLAVLSTTPNSQKILFNLQTVLVL